MANTEPITPGSRRFSFRLPRPLWIGVATVVLVVGGVAVQFRVIQYRHQRQLAAIREIESAYGYVQTRPGGPEWLRLWVGDERMKVFDEVVEAQLDENETTDAKMGEIRGLAHLKGMAGLQRLWLNDTKVTDAGMAHLNGMTKLERLWLANTRVTDAGATNLEGALPGLTIIR